MSIQSKKNIMLLLEKEIASLEEKVKKGFPNAFIEELWKRKLNNLMKAYLELALYQSIKL
jgi:hypothetical protein